MNIRPYVTSITYDKYSREQTGDIIMFAQFEEDYLLSETPNDAEIGYISDDNSIIPPLLSKEEMGAMDYEDESDDDPMSTEMLEDILDGSQSRPNMNRRKASYKILDRIKQKKLERKGALKAR